MGQTHEAIRIGDGFFKEFGNFARRTIYISDGTHDAIGAHDLYFNQVARQLAPIRLTGKFGSEVVPDSANDSVGRLHPGFAQTRI